ncbi:acetyl-CoA synthetase-like protein [Mytilinidion resinicola]|uniref:Acetyl-CoA synthetase-like protein n=1 Tax=Mytilinidion resinicola TaxID=574789 RepID=A0A6A6Y1I3_9PEZI|nr:acetyl-CoA synthetase-like protein [Mytilinidion resinicola]KAF2802373.1 acetyl-CoA synthetase-like protein [Mytilinidion resinicola]
MTILRSKSWVDIPNDTSISELMLQNVSNTPLNKIIYEDALTGKTTTYGAFQEHVQRAAYWLRHTIGFKPGQTLSISSPSSTEYIVVVHAVWWLGGVASLVNNSLHQSEIAHALDLINPNFLVVHDSVFEKASESLKLCEKHHDIRVLTLGKRSAQWTAFPAVSLPAAHPKIGKPYSLKGKDARKHLAGILLSSGTTGRPKAVMLSHYNLVAAIHQLRGDNPDNWRGSQREIFFPPLSHVYALYVCITGCFWLGAYVCLMPRFDLELYCRLMQDRNATLARLVPPIAKMLAENPVVRKYSYPSLEYFSCSAAPLTAETAEKLSKAFPHVALCQTYGCTELSGPCVQSGVRDKTMALGASGKLIANTEMRFLDLDCKDVGASGPGEITVRGPNVFMWVPICNPFCVKRRGYKDDELTTQESMIDGDWLRTGDLGYIDKDGFLVLYDRLKDIIKYKGFQVSPLELEDIAHRHPLVDEVAICGVWSESEATELPRAYVVLKKEVEKSPTHLSRHAESISNFVSEKVSTYKQLRGIVFVDDLPKNPTGKILRRVLRMEREKYENGPIRAKL